MGSNVDRLREAHQAFNERRHEDAATVMGPDAVFTDHGNGITTRSHSEFVAWLSAFTAASSDIAIRDAVYIDGGDWVTATFQAEGVQDGPLASFPPTGKRFTLDVCEVWHFAGGGPADEGHSYSGVVPMLIQLGHLPAPGQ